MTEVVWQFVVALSVLAISGVFFIAYNHPKQYLELSFQLRFGLLVVSAVVLGWIVSNTTIAIVVPRELGMTGEAKDALFQAIHNYNAPVWVMPLLAALTLVVGWLRGLRGWLIDDATS